MRVGIAPLADMSSSRVQFLTSLQNYPRLSTIILIFQSQEKGDVVGLENRSGKSNPGISAPTKRTVNEGNKKKLHGVLA